MITSTIAKPGL